MTGGVEIRPYTKPNGHTYYRVYWGEELAGQFFSLRNARQFVSNELRPLLRSHGIAA